MKARILAVVLLFAAVSLAHTSCPPAPNPPQPQAQPTQPDAKANCPCCEKMAAAKDMNAKDVEMCCARHHDASSDSPMSCCQGKDGKAAMSCGKGDAGCCGDKASGKDDKGCCDHCAKGTEQARMSCCAGNHEHGDMAHGHCGMMNHDHADMNR